MNTILLITYWAVGLFTAILQYKLNFSMKNIVLENTLPVEAINQPEVKIILKDFLKKLLLSVFLFGLILMSILFIRYDSVVMFLFFITLFGNLAAQFILNIKAIEEMRQLKIQKGWLIENQEVVVDLKALKIKNRKVFPAWWFLIPIALNTGVFIFQISTQTALDLLNMNIFNFLLFLTLSIWLYILIRKMPVKALSTNTQVNSQINDIQKSFWCKMLLAILGFSIITSFSFVFFSDGSQVANLWAFLLVILSSIGLVIYSTYVVFAYRSETNQLLANTWPILSENDDQYWKYGVYINSNDSRLFIPSRVSNNISINLGKLSGKIIAIVTGVALFLGLGFLIVMLGFNDFTPQPFRANIEEPNQTLVISNFLSSRRVPVSQIKSVSMVATSSLNNARRINGTATQGYRTGTFRLDERTLYILIFNSVDKVVKIQTENQDYYLNQRTLADTQALYEKLQSLPE